MNGQAMNEQATKSAQAQTPDEPKVEVRLTADGSATLYVPALDEYYHSTHGARQESAHVFIKHGLAPLLAAGAPRTSSRCAF